MSDAGRGSASDDRESVADGHEGATDSYDDVTDDPDDGGDYRDRVTGRSRRWQGEEPEPSERRSPREVLRDLREGRNADYAFAVAWVVAVAVGALHWGGLVVGGALVGVLAPSFLRALQRGLYVGVGVLAAFGAYLLAFGALDTFLGMGQITLLTAAISLVFPVLGASVRAFG